MNTPTPHRNESPRPRAPVRAAWIGLAAGCLATVAWAQAVDPAPVAAPDAAEPADELFSGSGPKLAQADLAAAELPDPEVLATASDADVDREAALHPADELPARAAAPEAEADETFVDGELPLAGADPAEEELVPVVPAPVHAGSGFLSFYDFNQVPFWFDPLAFNYLPYTGGLFSYLPPLASHQAGPFRYGGGLTAGVAYTDNVFGSSHNRQGDAIWTVTPSIFIEAGHRAKVRLLYAPSFQGYTRYSSQSTVNQTLLLTFELPFKRLRVGGGFGYLTRRGIFAEAGGIASQDSYSGNIYAAYPIGLKTTARIDYGISVTNSDPGGTAVENVVTLSVDHQLTSRTTVGGYVSIGAVTADAGDQEYVTAGLSATHVVSSRLRFSGSVGVQFRNLADSGSFGDGLVTPVVSLGAVWTPTDRVTIYAGAFRDLRNNPFDPSQTVIRTGGNLGAAIVLAPKLTLGLNGSLAYMEQISGHDDNDSKYVFAFGEASLTYQLNGWSSVRAFYSHALRSAVSGTDSFDQNTVGVSVAVTF